MSATLFEIGARLRAAETGTPVPLSHYAPVLPPVSPIAATVDTDGEHTYLTAATDTSTRSGTDRDALTALAELGATLGVTHRTLVIGSGKEMTLLARLARKFPDEPAAAVIGWWDQRMDYPGTEAVHVVTEAAALRWALGVHPDQEREVQTWREWLGVTSTGAASLLELARLSASGSTLWGLLTASKADASSWGKYLTRLGAGRPWWASDTRIDAALGLTARSHAAEWFQSLRLDDPLVALAHSYYGTVVPGQVIAVDEKTVTVQADQPLSRLRVGSTVTAWHGDPLDSMGASCLDGSVLAATIDTAAHLLVTVGTLRHKPKGILIGDRVCLRPAQVDPFMQATGRTLMASGYWRGTNWIAGRGKPIQRRGDVPLDVVVAAASDQT